ncbi:UNKNOWN [Stylonychia lemnae]|uniref:Uncharacterized protein n=1 Tax=Stylonychia lemnae TaxID=5949 RepID=A0A078AE69_STYLE|nr:UNKNOWN [Stylonychia lemnae]|eukprot:CDW80490.1 UNKNOWN [Stylonychia lemnae]
MNILYYKSGSINLPHCEDSDNSDDEHFISIGADSNKKGHMIDVYVSLISDIESKMIVNINQLGLSGLQAIELKKVNYSLTKKNQSSSNPLKYPQIPVSTEGIIQEYLKANDHIICDVDSLDFWIKFRITMDSQFSTLDGMLELRIEKSMTGQTFNSIAQKLCIQLWKQYCLDAPKHKDQKYVLTFFRVAIDRRANSIIKHKVDQSGHIISPKNKKNNRRTQRGDFHHDILPDSKMSDIFQYLDNNVKVKCTFQSIKQIYQEQFPIENVAGSTLKSDVNSLKQSMKTEKQNDSLKNKTPKSQSSIAGNSDNSSKKNSRKNRNTRLKSLLVVNDRQSEEIKEEWTDQELLLSKTLPKDQMHLLKSVRLPSLVDKNQLDTKENQFDTKENQFENSLSTRFNVLQTDLETQGYNSSPMNKKLEFREQRNNPATFQQNDYLLTHSSSIVFQNYEEGRTTIIKRKSPRPSKIEADMDFGEQAQQNHGVNHAFGNIILPKTRAEENQLTEMSIYLDTQQTIEPEPLQVQQQNRNIKLEQIQEEEDSVSQAHSNPQSPEFKSRASSTQQEIFDRGLMFRNYFKNELNVKKQKNQIAISINGDSKIQFLTTLQSKEESHRIRTLNIPINSSLTTSQSLIGEHGQLNSSGMQGSMSESDRNGNYPFEKKSIGKLEQEIEAKISLNREQIRKLSQSFATVGSERTSSEVSYMKEPLLKQFSDFNPINTSDDDNILRPKIRLVNQQNLGKIESQANLNNQRKQDLGAFLSVPAVSLTTPQNNSKKASIFGNLINIIRGTPRAQAGNKKFMKFGEQDIEISEEEMINKIRLPEFLLSFEEFQIIKIPAMKNFTYKERDQSDRSDSLIDNILLSDQYLMKQKAKKRNILVIIIILLVVAALVTGIVFLIKK